MRDCPDAASLLNVARDVVRKELVPNLPAGLRYEGLMVANALAIAARQFSAATVSERAELYQVANFLGEGAVALPREADADSERSALIEVNRWLCREIRAGRFDPEKPFAGRLMDHLRRTTRVKLEESNPKALGR
jgi:hypothetical protein